ncbi:MAG: AI-2E family transporter [Firmicutes bacterium]|nr:AI-2E family transporter [Bacillota bacterium]
MEFKKYFFKGLTAFGVIAASISFFFILYKWDEVFESLEKLAQILAPITIGLVIAYLLNPIMMFFENKIFLKYLPMIKIKKLTDTKIKELSRYFSISCALIIAGVTIYLLSYVIIPEIITSIKTFIANLPAYGSNIIKFINDFFEKNPSISELLENNFHMDRQAIIRKLISMTEEWAKNSVLSKAGVMAQHFATGFVGVYNSIKNFIIGIIVSVYVLFNKEIFTGQTKKLVYTLFPEKKANILIKTARKSNTIFSGFVFGKILDSTIIGIISFITLFIMDMPYYVLVSVIIGVTNIIPFFGPFIGAIPCSILILIVDPLKGLYFIIFILILQQIDGNIIGPKILGDSTGLSAFWVLFSILTFGGLLGFLGMVIGVPVFAVIYYIVKEISTYLLTKKDLPTVSEEYRDIEKIEHINDEKVITYISKN